MWLPTSVYERIPEFWVLMGLLFFALGLYVGFGYSLTFLYLGIGVGCFIRGIFVQVLRWRYRANTSDAIES
jgi:hypothetical protein